VGVQAQFPHVVEIEILFVVAMGIFRQFDKCVVGMVEKNPAAGRPGWLERHWILISRELRFSRRLCKEKPFSKDDLSDDAIPGRLHGKTAD
jgi:hypothetical protein